MSDAARAEARRQRILQNSQNRLQKITGRIEDPPRNGIYDEIGESPLDSLQMRDFPDDSSTFRSHFDDIINNETVPHPFRNAEDIAELQSTQENVEYPPKRSLLGNSKLRVAMFAVAIHILLMFSNTSLSSYFFMPLLVIEIINYFIGQPIKPNPTLTALLGLSGMAPHRLAWVVQIAQVLGILFGDACLYLFVFVLMTTLKTSSI